MSGIMEASNSEVNSGYLKLLQLLERHSSRGRREGKKIRTKKRDGRNKEDEKGRKLKI